MTDTIFQKIIDKEIPAEIVYEDEQCLAFKDIEPQAPVHILIIPKISIAKVIDATEEDELLLGHMIIIANKIAKEQNIADGYQLVINNGAKGGQSVFHLHLHLIGGRILNWPPG